MNSSNEMNNSDPVLYLIPAAVVTNIVLSLPTNGYIAWLIVTGAEDTLLREFFPLNLSVFEILYCFFSLSVLINQDTNHLVSTSVCCGADAPCCSAASAWSTSWPRSTQCSSSGIER